MLASAAEVVGAMANVVAAVMVAAVMVVDVAMVAGAMANVVAAVMVVDAMDVAAMAVGVVAAMDAETVVGVTRVATVDDADQHARSRSA